MKNFKFKLHKLNKLGKLAVLLGCLVLFANCSKSSDKNRNNNQCYNQQYQQYGQQQTYYNPQCYNNGVGQYPGQPGSGQGTVCHGIYWYQGQPAWCDGQTRNCAGYTLQQNVSSNPQQPGQPGQTVYCQ